MYQFQQLSSQHLTDVLLLEQTVIQHLPSPDLLRRNTPEMWLRCLQPPHTSIGAFYHEQLVALAVLYQPSETDGEDLSHLIERPTLPSLPAANFKICIVHPRHRGHKLQQQMGLLLETYAVQAGIRSLCATASPQNAASIHSLERLGYQYCRTLIKYGLQRNIYYKQL